MESILHQGHLDIENCKKRGSPSIILATYKQIIRRHDFKIPPCPTYRTRQPGETPIKPEIPDHHWTW